MHFSVEIELRSKNQFIIGVKSIYKIRNIWILLPNITEVNYKKSAYDYKNLFMQSIFISYLALTLLQNE